MYSKKEEFTNTIQFIIGERIENLEASSYNNIEDLAALFQAKSDKTHWKSMHYFPIYYILKTKVQELLGKENVLASINLNAELNQSQKIELMNHLKDNKIKVPELTRPALLEKLIYLFPLAAVMGTLLICTYYITKYDITGWIYLFGLLGLILSVLLIVLTKPLRNQLKENSLIEFAKLTYAIKHKDHVKNANTKKQLIDFLTNEVEVAFGKRFTPTETIPEN